ncbi:glycosyltransferase [Sphingomonas sp. RB1R13]|uniref:glycosyltransferase n=1 Tax=Sphingomonas sp. RB1R13 TaxID=3096159 RepID=UPI002FCAD6F1
MTLTGAATVPQTSHFDVQAPVHDSSKMICDLTQSWSEVGGGVRTYLMRKRQHILENTQHRHLLIIPGPKDETITEDRCITVFVKSPRVPGSPHYRLLLRNRAVRRILELYRPTLIECQDAYNLPWAAIAHREKYLDCALVAAYMTDLPTVYVERPLTRFLSAGIGEWGRGIAMHYCRTLYGKFDAVFALSKHGGADKLEAAGLANVPVVPLGIDLSVFTPDRRDHDLRASIGVSEKQPVLIYAGRLDHEKRAQIVLEAFRLLPPEVGAKLVMLGEGPLRQSLLAHGVIAPGFLRDRREVARWLASSDIYVSAMADETFGISVIEAQASGLPIVGVKAGAMIDRISPATGRLGAVDDAREMAANILEVWAHGSRAMGHLGRNHVETKFSWDQTMRTLFTKVYSVALYNTCLPALSRGQS